MIIRPRIIPTLLIDEGNLVKTKHFKNPNYLGDPINAIKIFNEKGVDELCVLDISASKKSKTPDMKLLKNMATEAFMPLSYGGGVTTFEQMKEIFYMGFEKVVLNTSFVQNFDLFEKAAVYFGSQSIVASVDYKKGLGKNSCYIMDGTQKVRYTPVELSLEAEKLGAGEILLYSIDHDGMKNGYDIKMISEITRRIQIPVIACGGAGDLKDLKNALDAGAHAVAAGSLFVYFGNRDAVLINFPDEKELIQNNIFEEQVDE